MRRLLFQVHAWLGVLAGLYVVIVCASGAALVFRIDMQRALHPSLFTPTASGPLADPVAVMDSVNRAYPRHRLSGVDAPTTLRPTYLAYVTSDDEFRTVLIDPVSTVVLGELPEHPAIRTLQSLHYSLLGGRTGRTVNGIGALVILALCASGLVIWWPGARQWRRGLIVDFSRERPRVIWELHRAAGIWSVAFIALTAVTAVSFVFPSGFRALVNRVSPITAARAPQSSDPVTASAPPSWRQMIDRARVHAGGRPVARVVLPFGDRGAFLVMFAERSPTPAGSELMPIYLDRHTGERLAATAATRTWGDAVMARMTPLHVGGVGGQAGRIAWFVLGLSPALLFVSGLVSWWRRVVRPRRAA
ncbi:MAG: PepSY-associated TM helix domain-containing protein [Vicinamibacterales bacterium]